MAAKRKAPARKRPARRTPQPARRKPQPPPQLSATLMLLYFGGALTLMLRGLWWLMAVLIAGALTGALAFVQWVAVR